MSSESKGRTTSNSWSVALGMLLLLLILLLILSSIIGFIYFLQKYLSSSLATAVIASATTVMVSVAGFFFSKWYEKQKDIQRDIQARKMPAYEAFIDMLVKVMEFSKDRKKKMEQEVLSDMLNVTKKLIIWGSDEVVKKYSVCRGILIDDNILDKTECMFLLEELLLSMRRDLGHKNQNIAKGDVLRLFLNDVDKYLPAKVQEKSSSN